MALARIIHERFCCNRRSKNRNLLRYSFFAPGSYEAPRSSLLRRSSHSGYEGRKLRGILRNSPKPLPSFAKAMEGSPRLHPRSSLLRRSCRFGCEGRKLRGIRRRRINKINQTNLYEFLYPFVIGIRLSFPKARWVILMPIGACRRLYSLPSTIAITRATVARLYPASTISSRDRSSST